MLFLNRRTLLTTGAAALVAAPTLAATGAEQIPKGQEARIVDIRAGFAAGELHVDPGQFALYWTLPDGRAIRYPVGIGAEGRYYSGTFRVGRKAEWPRWTPTKAMIRREPELYKQHAAGMAGGPGNPLGARALYLYNGNRDSLLRIHGTHRSFTVGTRVSNGCVRMFNSHVVDLYNRVPKGTRVVLH